MRFLVVAFFLTLALPITSFAADAKAGKKLWKKVNCAQCHDKDGMGKAKMKDGEWKLNAVKGPRIAGLDAKYAEEQLKAIRDKKRKTRFTISMMAKIKKLSDEDLANLAAYIGKELNPKAGSFKGMEEK